MGRLCSLCYNGGQRGSWPTLGSAKLAERVVKIQKIFRLQCFYGTLVVAICITFEFNRSGLSVVTYCSPCIAFIYITIHQLTIHQLTIHQLCSGLVGRKQSVAPATAATAIYPARLLPHFTVTASQFPWHHGLGQC